MSAVKYTLTFKRKYSYYLLNMLLPILFLNLLSLLVFVLPAQSGGRVGYSLTILLSLSVVMTLVSDNIPRTSTNTCLLSVYLLIQFILSCLVVLTVVVNLKVHHMGEQGRKMPRWAKRFTRKVLARLTCSKRSKVDVVESFDPNVGKLTSTKEHGKDNDMIFEKSKPTSPSMRDNDETDYSFEEVAMMLDTICLLVFCVLTFIITLTVLLTLASSDA